MTNTAFWRPKFFTPRETKWVLWLWLSCIGWYLRTGLTKYLIKGVISTSLRVCCFWMAPKLYFQHISENLGVMLYLPWQTNLTQAVCSGLMSWEISSKECCLDKRVLSQQKECCLDKKSVVSTKKKVFSPQFSYLPP